MSTNTMQEAPLVPVLSIIVTDAGGKITSFSEGAEKMFGWKASEVVGKSVAMMHTEQGVREFGKILGDAANGRYEGNLAFKKKNDELFQAHLQVLATKDKSGRVNSYIGITYQI
ncbi:MAG TPA: PAS domain-containing protein [Candidatus Binatus sp.]|nr:PAS domain-containing protein [Candidatus Binatus sp.]